MQKENVMVGGQEGRTAPPEVYIEYMLHVVWSADSDRAAALLDDM